MQPTASQIGLYNRLEAMFGRTDEFRCVAAEYGDFLRANPARAYVFISALQQALQGWKYTRLPRYAGLPRSADERRANLRRCLREERKVRIEVPEEKEWVIDTRPSAFGDLDYFEQNPELRESLELDRGFVRETTLYHLVQ